MSSRILEKLLYDQRIKVVANVFLDFPFVFQNPFYHFFQNLQIKRVINRYRLVPFALRIENTNVCSAKCFMCPHPTMKRPQGFMDKDLYTKIIDEAVLLGIEYVNLHNFGEPLLDKDFVWRIEYAKKKGINKISTNTNGQFMDEKLSLALINSGLSELFVSLDAATEETYKKIRTGLDFKRVIYNVEQIIKLKKKTKSLHPKVTVDFLESEINRTEEKKFFQQWRRKADNICISKIHDWTAKKKGILESPYVNFVSFSKAPCRLPFTELLVNWDGTASLCCQDIEAEEIIGNAKKQTLVEIWRGEKLNRIRAKHLALDVGDLVLCRNCKLRTFWWTF